ncbi:unnamed protein product [Lota lota]
MISASKLKVVSSGRLTGATRRGATAAVVQKVTKPPTGLAYSLYSTDSEDQVITIHKGLDRCATMLDCILQADLSHPLPRALAPSPPLPRALAQSHPLPRALAQSPPLPRTLAPHSLPSIPLRQRRPQTNPDPDPYTSPLVPPLSQVCPPTLPGPAPQPHALVPLSQPVVPSDPPAHRGSPGSPLQTSFPASGQGGGGLTSRVTEEECTPVRDVGELMGAGAEKRPRTDRGERTDLGERTDRGERTDLGERTDREETVNRVQHVLEELRSLLAGKDCPAAERLLSEFEWAVVEYGDAQMTQGTRGPRVTQRTQGTQGTQMTRAMQALRSQNSQLHRRMRILNQQLQERERAERHCRESHCNAMSLQAELSAIQSQMGRLQAEVMELRKALQEKEVENARIRADPRATRGPARCPGMSSQVLLLAQRRLKEMESRPDLCRWVSRPPPPAPHTHTLISLLFKTPEMKSGAGLDPERLTFAPLREVVTSSLGCDGQSFQNILQLLQRSSSLIHLPGLNQSHSPPANLGQSRDTHRDCRLDASSLAHCEVASDGSGYTFDTRDEVEFCNGLAALDASIASLQRTLKKDLVM